MDQERTQQEAERIFRQLNAVNRQYAMGVLQSLAFAQRAQEADPPDPAQPQEQTHK